jgi:hypothetical protein
MAPLVGTSKQEYPTPSSTMTSDTDSVLVLHTTCSNDDAEGKERTSSSHEWVPSGNRIAKSIQELPIVCDLLILPENPSVGHNTSHSTNSGNEERYIELLDNKFHPCGLSNVLMLQDLSAWESLLLSLTSCRIDTGGNKAVPVEPFPSTFDFTFGHGIEEHSLVAELSIRFDLSLARRMLADAEDDLADHDAIRDLQAIAPEQKNTSFEESQVPHSTIVGEPNSSKHDPAGDSPPRVEACDHIPELKSVHDFYMDMCISPLQSPHKPQPELSFERRLEELLILQDRLDKEADYWNFVFEMLCMFGIFLLALLFWMISRLYRPVEEEKSMKEARASLKRKLQVLAHVDLQSTIAPCSFDTYPEERACAPPSPIIVTSDEEDPPLQRAPKMKHASNQGIGPVCLDAALEEAARSESSTLDASSEGNSITSKIPKGITVSHFGGTLQTGTIVGDAKSNVDPLLCDYTEVQSAHPTTLGEEKDATQITPPRATEAAERLSGPYMLEPQPGSGTFDPRCFDDKKIQKVPTDEDGEARSMACTTSPRAAEDDVSSRSNSSVQDRATGETVRLNTLETDSKKLSPCSKLAQEWAAKKTVRRNNRRRKQPLLQRNRRRLSIQGASKPDIASGDVTGRSFLTPVAPDEVIGPPSVRSLSNGEEFSPQMAIVHDRGPPQPTTHASHERIVRSPSFRCDQGTITYLQDIQQLHSENRKVQPTDSKSPSVIPAIPGLCSTPTSEEGDSFVDDYW